MPSSENSIVWHANIYKNLKMLYVLYTGYKVVEYKKI